MTVFLWGERAAYFSQPLRLVSLLGLSSFLFLWGAMLYSLTPGLENLSFDLLLQSPQSNGREGGVLSIVVATIGVVGLALLVALPISLLIAWNLSENYNSLIAKWTSNTLDLLAGMPSIVFGLCGNAVFVRYFGFGYSIAAGGLTLAVMILPLTTKVMQQQFESFGSDLKRNCLALGIGPAERLLKFQLPASFPAIGSMVVLGTARSMSETAALLLTSGFVDRMPESLADSGRTLSVHIYNLAMNVPGAMSMAMTSAWVLCISLVALNFALAFLLQRRNNV